MEVFMKALQWNGSKLELSEVPLPEPAEGEALIRLTRAGICNTDLEIMAGYYPFNGTLGHEFVGVVEQVRDTSLIGKRVVADINNSCHGCLMCHAGEPHHCLNRSALGIKGKDGAFAEYLTTPTENLVLVPDDLEDDQAVFAEPLAAALEIQEQVDFSDGREAAVIGDGKLGLLICYSLVANGIPTTLIGHHPERKSLLDLPGIQFLDAPPDRQFPVVIEATGNPSGFDDALSLTMPRGTLVLKSTYKAPLTFNAGPVVVNELTIIGSRCGPMEKAIGIMATGKVNPRPLVDDLYPLAEGVSAVSKAKEKGSLKILLTMDQ